MDLEIKNSNKTFHIDYNPLNGFKPAINNDKYDRSIFLLLNILLPALLFSLIIIKFIAQKIGTETKTKIAKNLILSFPVWFALILFVLYGNSKSLLASKADLDLFSALPAIIALVILGIFYTLLAIRPANTAHIIINVLSKTFKKEKRNVTFWTILDKLKAKRFLILLCLTTSLAAITLANFYLIFLLNQNDVQIGFVGPSNSEKFLDLLTGLYLLVLFLYFIKEFFDYGKVRIPRVKHKKSIEVKKAIENIAITAGLPEPEFQILARNNPTAFSLRPNFGQATIFITARLLNMADKNELEAVIAHEMAHIFSGRLVCLRRVNNLLSLIKASAFLLFFFLLLNWNPMAIIFWFLITGALFIGTIRVSAEENISLSALVTFVNPPFLLINFLSYFVYYSIAYNEEFYSDLKAVELTRYPEGLYSIIQKLKNYKEPAEALPREFGYLYFTGEKTTFDDAPMSQPAIEARQEVLENIDNTLSDLNNHREPETLPCPQCQNIMNESWAKGFLGNALDFKQCEKCGSAWFDESKLWLISDLTKINDKQHSYQEDKDPNGKMSCPRCGIKLSLLKEKDLPTIIQIWYCHSCHGNWLNEESIAQYGNFRKKYLGRNS